jgi:signal transduction histidine kinase
MNAQIRARLYERVAERERISQDLHDTFFQGVQGLFLRFRTATARLEKDQPVRLMLEEVLAQSHEVMLEGRQLLTGLHAGVTDMLDLANAYTVAAKELQKIRIVDLKVAVKGEPRALHPIVFEELYKIGREALGNAFSHSDTAKIVIELVYSSHALHVHLRDYGKGIDPGILAVGFRAGHWGLPGMKERSRKIGAAFSVWSQIGEGTAVDIKVPAATAYASGPQHLFKRLSRMFQRTD